MIRPTMPWRDSTSTGWEAPIRVKGFPAATLVRRPELGRRDEAAWRSSPTSATSGSPSPNPAPTQHDHPRNHTALANATQAGRLHLLPRGKLADAGNTAAACRE